MLRKIGLLLGVAACGALVTSCGGGNSSTPTPTPTGTSTATPTPTPAATFSLTNSFTAENTNTGYIFAYFTPTAGGAEVFSDASRINGTTGIAFVASPDSVTFSFPDLTDPAVFGAADFVSVSATQRVYQSGDRSLTMQLPFAQVLQVSYAIANQAFTRGTVAGTLRSQRVALFYNQVTTTADITAPLTYTGQTQVAGGDPDVTASGVLSSPQTTFTVTPGTADTLTGTLNVFQTVNNVQTQVASFAISTPVLANGTFGGNITDTGRTLAGQFAGTLAGPNRDEIVLVFVAADSVTTDTDDRKYVGSFVGN